jgi:hypothetical protein
MKVAAGSGRANDIIKLPGGDHIQVKVGRLRMHFTVALSDS